MSVYITSANIDRFAQGMRFEMNHHGVSFDVTRWVAVTGELMVTVASDRGVDLTQSDDEIGVHGNSAGLDPVQVHDLFKAARECAYHGTVDMVAEAAWDAAWNTVHMSASGFTPRAFVDRGEWIIGGVVAPVSVRVRPSDSEQVAGSAAEAAMASRVMDLAEGERVRLAQRLWNGEVCVGAWVDPDRSQVLALDVCDTHEDETTALAVAAFRGERAIWHPVHGERTI